MDTAPERDLFLLKELNDESAEEIIKGIIKINVYDAEQEKKVVDYKRNPIRIHISTPRWRPIKMFCNL